MAATDRARILICAGSAEAAEDLRRPLERVGHTVAGHALNGTDPDNLTSYHLVVLEGSRQGAEALQFCRRLRDKLADSFVPILFVTSDPTPAGRLASFEGGADTYLLRPFVQGELLAQVGAFLRIKELHDRLADKTAEVNLINKRLQAVHQQVNDDLELARRIQLSFLPQSLPDLKEARFAVYYYLCGRVGGDFYDVFRLDENHIGLYVADAMGHGVPASLLTIFVKKGVRAKEIFQQQYRLVPPGEVLQRLNHELVEQAMSGHPFITMVYALFNFKEGSLSFARAGHPYPLYLPREGPPCFWELPGSLLGVFETVFPMQTQWLHPGDKVLLYSDGIDAASFEGHAPGAPSLLACGEKHRALPIQEFVDQVARELSARSGQADDLTLLGLEMCE